MRLRPLVALLALVLGTSLVACGSDADAGPQIRRVGDGYDTIQDAVDAAKPGDLVLIEAGTYREAVDVKTPRLVIRGEDRNTVILDGQDKRTNGFEVTADQVAIENLTVRRFAVNGIIFTGSYQDAGPQDGPKGWRASYITAANNGLYGIYAFGSTNGQIDHSLASGHPDSGIYVGQCTKCGAVVRDNTMERNAIGYENTNASGVTVAGNIARRNRIGMTIASGDQEELAPQSGGTIAANLVVDNDEAEAPVTEGGFGVGIAIAGGRANVVERNEVTGHQTAGIVLVDQDAYAPSDNQVRDNTLGRNAVDLALTSDAGSSPDDSGGGNCFAGNDAASSVPPDIEALLPCSGSAGTLPDAALDRADPPPPFDYRDTPLPAKQPNRPGSADGPWQAPSTAAPKLDPTEVPVPTP